MGKPKPNSQTDDYFDWLIVVFGLLLGIIGGVLIGIPLWITTGYPNYIRVFFFLGICVGGLVGTGMASGKSRKF